MTNEEKARELAIEYCKDIDDKGREVYNVFCEEACLQMAKWKDEQFNRDVRSDIEKARGMYKEGLWNARLEYIFPELKESEDERIRKLLIDIVKVNSCGRVLKDIDKSEYQNCLAWLEKQEEKKSTWKPSEYDISLLEEIAKKTRYDVRPFCSEISALEDLIKNLKNL